MVDVKQVQGLINRLNFATTLDVDGIEGIKTRGAMSQFESLFPTEGKCNTFSLKRVIKQKDENTLDVPYVSQRSDYKYSYRMCNLACVNMLLKYYGNNNYSVEALDKYVDNDTEIQTYAMSHALYNYAKAGTLEQNSSIMILVLEKLLKKDFTLDYITKDKIIELLKDKKPVILATKLSGYSTKDATKGHYVTIVGHFGDMSVIHDPYGLYLFYYSDDNSTKGKNVVIPDSVLFGEFGCKTAYEEVKRIEENKTKYRCVFLK